jgi:hypothetical protein
MNLTPEQVTEALTARQVSTQCPRCATPDAFDVFPGLFRMEVVGNQNLNNAVLVCRHCGHVALHSLEVLGIEW